MNKKYLLMLLRYKAIKGCSARQNWAKKRSLHGVNEHFEPALIYEGNAAMRPSVLCNTVGLLAVLWCAFTSAHAAPVTLMLGNFTAGDKTGWEEQVFKGKTEYTFTPGKKGERALQVRSAASASGLHKKMAIDLTKTPYLNWAWKIDNTLKGLDETTKKGDDYPARLYVVVSGGFKFWKSEAVNYVWSSTERPPNATWPNAYTENVIMVAVDSGDSKIGSWVTHKRNLRDDLKRYFGKDVEQIDAVALMVDTDNSGQKAISYYGNIYMSSE